jgi:hypothetical protein
MMIVCGSIILVFIGQARVVPTRSLHLSMAQGDWGVEVDAVLVKGLNFTTTPAGQLLYKGKKAWGTDGIRPSVQLKSLVARIGSTVVRIPMDMTEDIFAPPLLVYSVERGTGFSVSCDSSKRLRIRCVTGDNAGYIVTWRVSKERVVRRWIRPNESR